jgi:cleavage and polyadenylation specificity factor subunit 6/7
VLRSGTSETGGPDSDCLADQRKQVGYLVPSQLSSKHFAGGPGGNMAGGPTSNVASEYIAKHTGQAPDSGGLMLFVGELQWWTTDAELEAALSEYGRVKNLKFFEEKASGKSKGYCQVEFFDSQAARVCKEKMDGRVFNGRACVVAFASPQTIKQMGAAQIGKNQAGPQSQGQAGQGKKMAEGGRGAGAPPPGGEGRGFNKGGRGGQSGLERGRGNQGPGRGRGRGMAPFGPQGPMGGPPGGMMPPQGMMGQGFEPGFGPPMGRGGGYGMGPGGGGFGPRGPPFSGMGPPFPPMGGLPGVPAHVNPAFFGRANGSGPGMGPGGMEGPPGGWGEVGMPGWEDHERRMREGGYAGEDMGGGEFGYGGEMGRVGPGRERERGAAEGEWGPERRRREERGGERSEEWERGERHRTGDRDAYREQRGERSEREKEKDWDRSERPTSRGPREKDDDRVRSREDDHGKRRRMVTDRKAER